MAELRKSPTVRRRRLSRELRRLRETAGMTADQASKALEWSQGKISRIEQNGWQRPDVGDIKHLLDLYGITEEANAERRAALLQLTRDSRERGWWTEYKSALDSGYIGFEAEAAKIHTYQTTVVPGLLQTADYAAALVRAELARDPEEIRQRVELRMRRQEILVHPDPPLLWAVIDEAALRRGFGTAAMQAEQLQKLIDSYRLENVTIQVIPFNVGLHPGMSSSFVVLDYDDDPSLVYIETATRSMYLEDPAEVDRHSLLMEHLLATALSPTESMRYLARMIEDLE
ncbi:helix-turn-helix domain-containing protein [Spirillospora sp. CA-253888]